jgi:hypothetical protein
MCSVCQTATVIPKVYTASILMVGTKEEAVASLQTSVPIPNCTVSHITFQKTVILIRKEPEVSHVLRTFKQQIKINEYFGDFRLPPRCIESWELRILDSAEWQFHNEVSGYNIGYIFKGPEVFLDSWVLENGNDRLSRNVGTQLSLYAAF